MAKQSSRQQLLQDMRVPTPLLLGGASPREICTGIECLAAALPDGRVVEPPGAGIRPIVAPELLAQGIIQFPTVSH